MDRRKIRRACGDLKSTKGQKGAIQYNSIEALSLLYGHEEAEGEESRLTRMRADKVELELDAMRGKFLPREEVVLKVQKMFGAVRSRLLSIPSKASPELAIMDSPTKIRAHMEALIHEALRELAGYNSGG
jgi:hypothetical protein